MPDFNRARWRVADQIVAALLADRSDPALPTFPLQRLDELRRLHQQWDTAIARGWLVAAADVQATWYTRLQWWINDLQSLRSPVRPPLALVPTTAQVYRDLDALDHEFVTVTIDAPEHTVTVETDRIVLDGLDLGPFEIVWKWSRLDDPLRVIAQEPDWSQNGDEVCHPHVRGEELCVGDAQPALGEAFRSGRVFDAFLILRQVLQTYNPQSAYAAVDQWHGNTCTGCATGVAEDDTWWCTFCNDALCDECHRSCDACGNPLCHTCGLSCPECETFVCPSCRPIEGGRRLTLCRLCYETSDEDLPDDRKEISVPPASVDAPTPVNL